jgi:glycosyltransferase involved in cell wall biosynthesis
VNPALVSIVLPVYNQEAHIGKTLAEYADALDRLPIPYELLPVVNGPRRDRSLEICRETEAGRPSVRTLCIDEGGWGRAVRAGLREARGDLLCYTNSARTTAKELTLLVLYGIVHPDHVIKAMRKVRESALRRLGSLLYNLECRALFDLPYWDINGTPKIFPRDLAPLTTLASDDDLIDLEFHVLCRRHDYPMLEVPVFSSRRHAGKSTTNFRSAFHMYTGAVRLRKRMGRP